MQFDNHNSLCQTQNCKTWICSHNCLFPANPANGAGSANVAGHAKGSEPQSGDISVEKDEKKG